MLISCQGVNEVFSHEFYAVDLTDISLEGLASGVN